MNSFVIHELELTLLFIHLSHLVEIFHVALRTGTRTLFKQFIVNIAFYSWTRRGGFNQRVDEEGSTRRD
jgi:hypothetical protein